MYKYKAPPLPASTPPDARADVGAARASQKAGRGETGPNDSGGGMGPGVGGVTDACVELALGEPLRPKIGRHVFCADVAEGDFAGGNALEERVVSAHEVARARRGRSRRADAHIGEVVSPDEGGPLDRAGRRWRAGSRARRRQETPSAALQEAMPSASASIEDRGVDDERELLCLVHDGAAAEGEQDGVDVAVAPCGVGEGFEVGGGGLAERSTLAAMAAGPNTELHVIPRSSARSVVDPVHAHSLDRFVEGEVATEVTPLLGQAAVRGEQTVLARAGRVGKSLATGAGGLVAGAGAGALTGVVLDGYGVTDETVKTVAGGAVGGLAQEALFGAAGVGTVAEGAAALGAGAAGGIGFVGGYEATKALGGNETVSTVVGVASGTALQAAAAESIGIAAEAAVGAAAGAVEAGAVALGFESTAATLGTLAVADFWNPLGLVFGALAASAAIAGGVIGAVESARGG